jgi:hypothetical protein
MAEIALYWSSAEKTGLEISRLRSSLPSSRVSKRDRSRSTASTELLSEASSKSEPAYRSATPEIIEPLFATGCLFSLLDRPPDFARELKTQAKSLT